MTKDSKQMLTINSVSQSAHKLSCLKINIKLYGFICYLKIYSIV